MAEVIQEKAWQRPSWNSAPEIASFNQMRADLLSSTKRIEAAFEAANLAHLGADLVEGLTAHFGRVLQGQGPVLNWNPPQENVADARRELNASDGAATPLDRESLSRRFRELLTLCLERGNNLHHPHYVGHQVPASIPLAGLFDAIGSATNQVMAIYEMGPWATAVERALLDEIGGHIGFAAGQFGGLITSGASLANLTALLTARNVTLDGVFEAGLTDRGLPPVLVAHAESHYCIRRAAGILGIGSDRVVAAPLDARRAIDPPALNDVLSDLRRRKVPIVAVVAVAGATPTGAFDQLDAIADICERHRVWMHVDAAHGGAACISHQHRELVSGLHRADSVVCDAHKMFFMPALCALLFYRERADCQRAFNQDAPYLFDPIAQELAEYDSGLRTVECTKRAAAFGLWGVWSLFGRELFEDLVDVTFARAREFYELLEREPDFEPFARPECNIVTFRYIPPSLRGASTAELSEFQFRVRRRIIESGQFYLVANSIDGVGMLRTTIINPLTRREHLQMLLEVIRTEAAKLISVTG